VLHTLWLVQHITGDAAVRVGDCVSDILLGVVGHITGRHDSHRSLTACPLYHNMSADECKACRSHVSVFSQQL